MSEDTVKSYVQKKKSIPYDTIGKSGKLIRNNKPIVQYKKHSSLLTQQKSVFQNRTLSNEKRLEPTKKQKLKALDFTQVVLVVAINAFLITSAYFILGTLSVIAMSVGAILVSHHLLNARLPTYSKLKTSRHGPPIFLLFLFASPFAFGFLVAYDGYAMWESPVRSLLLSALTITFWSTMLFIPMAVYSKYRENLQPDLQNHPIVSVLVPAYNEEKVISRTIESLIETNYPKKEIIVIDDGSKDTTLEIAKKYRDQIKVLHKENGGKGSALNYGLCYATGEIVVVIDADTTIGRSSLKEIVKGFNANKNVAAVAGNIKIRNKVNLITKCQALEYITGIQVIRRAFDLFGAITIVPGALGAFKKSILEETGHYQTDTIVEDFDATLKILKAGLITQGSTRATAYTEAPDTLNDFFKQRKRWYRGNIQVLTKHSDVLTNPRFGYLQRLAYPYLLLGMLISPIVGFVAIGNAIFALIYGDGMFVLQIFLVFLVVHYLMTALALRIDGEDMKLLLYGGFLVMGFKQLIDFLLLKAILQHILGKKAVWTSARRTGG